MFILVGVAIILAYFVYETLYFKSKKFLEIKIIFKTATI